MLLSGIVPALAQEVVVNIHDLAAAALANNITYRILLEPGLETPAIDMDTEYVIGMRSFLPVKDAVLVGAFDAARDRLRDINMLLLVVTCIVVDT